MILKGKTKKTSQRTWIFFIVIPALLLLVYLYWWLTRPSEKRLSSVEIETPFPTKAPKSTGEDDLTKIKGIGPKISETLRAQGVRRFSQIAFMSEVDLRKTLSEAGIRLVPSLDSWSEQARLAALDEWELLNQLQDSI